jgi:hypothetical protein
MAEAKVRFEANVAETRRCCATTKNPDYADVGDLAYIRQRLNEALGRENNDPPAKPRARQ